MNFLLGKLHILLVVKNIGRSVSTLSLSEVVDYIQHSRNILVMAGAGLSTPSGIPDFRSPESGLYSNLQKYKLPYPEAIFDLDYYAHNPGPFLDLARSIYPGAGNIKPNIGHYFIRLLENKEKLLRVYTQNIDGLERLTGLKENHLVEAHGGFSTSSCIKCGLKKDSTLVKNEILEGLEPRCKKCKGLVKPDITFFGEMLPKRFGQLSEIDTTTADFLIVIGTSLVVYPFANLADEVRDDVPRLLINRDSVGSFGSRDNDAVMLGDIIEQIKTLVQHLNWTEDLQAIINTSGNTGELI